MLFADKITQKYKRQNEEKDEMYWSNDLWFYVSLVAVIPWTFGTISKISEWGKITHCLTEDATVLFSSLASFWCHVVNDIEGISFFLWIQKYGHSFYCCWNSSGECSMCGHTTSVSTKLLTVQEAN